MLEIRCPKCEHKIIDKIIESHEVGQIVVDRIEEGTTYIKMLPHNCTKIITYKCRNCEFTDKKLETFYW